MEGRKIPGYEEDYYSIPQAAKRLQIPVSTLRIMANKGWLDEHNIQRKPEDVLQTHSNRKFISSKLVEKLKSNFYTPVG